MRQATKQQQIEFSPISRIVRLFLNVVIITVFAKLSYGWSFRETEQFNILIFGANYATAAALVFQVGPNAILALRHVSSGSLMIWLMWLFFFGLTAIDFITNGGQFYQWWQEQSKYLIEVYQIHPYVVNAAYVVGWVFCFAVCWFEEILLYLMGVSFHLMGLLYRDFTNNDPPRWLMVDLPDLAIRAGGGDVLPEQNSPLPINNQQRSNKQNRKTKQPPPIPYGQQGRNRS